MQRAFLSDRIFDVSDAHFLLLQVCELSPGDVIVIGTAWSVGSTASRVGLIQKSFEENIGKRKCFIFE